MSHDDFVALVASLTKTLAELRTSGPMALAQARDDLEAEAMPGSTRVAPGGHGGAELTGPERYAEASLAGRRVPVTVSRAEVMCEALRDASSRLWKARVAAGGALPAGVDRAKVGARVAKLAVCVTCDDDAPRPRRGMCEPCRVAWDRLPLPKLDIAMFRAQRLARRKEAEKQATEVQAA